MPHDTINEQVVLAAAIVDPAVRKRLIAALPVDSFFGKGHPEAWATLAEIDRRQLHYDAATVRQLSGGIVDGEYLDQLAEQRPAVPPNLMHHVECMHWDRRRVEAARGPVQALLDALREPSSEPEKLRALARQLGGSFEGGMVGRYLRDPAQLVREHMQTIRARRGGLACYPFGLDGFDAYGRGEVNERGEGIEGTRRILPGAAPGQITCVTGLSGSGKTTVTASIALAIANQGRRVLYGAWEQGSGMTLELMSAISLGYSRSRLLEGDLDDDELAILEGEMDRLAGSIRFFDLPFARVRGEKHLNDKNLDIIHQHVVDSACDVFIADLWRYALRQFDPDEEEHALKREKAIAEETKTHHILIHQQRLKDMELRDDKRPTREGLKGSGAWVEVSDTILGVHRPALWKNIPDNIVEVSVLKQRFGKWPLAVEFDYDPATGAIINGRSIQYARPDEQTSLDEFTTKAGGRNKGKGKRNAAA